MCNRFKAKLQAAQIRDLMSMDIIIQPEAGGFSPRDDVRPSTEALTIWEQDGSAILGTSIWGFPKLPHMGKGLVINARSERITTSPFWRDSIRCWLPATSWIEYRVENGRNVACEVGLPDGEPFLIAGVCGLQNGIRRMAMCMQDAPPRFAYLCDRLPIPFSFAAIGASAPAQVFDRMVVRS